MLSWLTKGRAKIQDTEFGGPNLEGSCKRRVEMSRSNFRNDRYQRWLGISGLNIRRVGIDSISKPKF